VFHDPRDCKISAHLFNAPQGWEIKTRTLTQCQFQYVVEGTADYTIEGKTYQTKRGDLIFHTPNIPHSVKTIEDNPYLCISIVFHFGSSRFPLAQLIGSSRLVGNFADHTMVNKLSQLTMHYHQPGVKNHIFCQGLLIQIIHDLHDWNEDQLQTKIQEKTKTKIVLIRNYIATHFSENITHKDLESISNLPFEYLTSVRIEKAKELAIQTHLSISEIAHMIGYSDVHTFGRMFKNKTGTSLSQFCSSLVTY
jgi:AraC-like DNA-binding protein